MSGSPVRRTTRSLKNLPGSRCDMALACLIHVGMKWLTPGEDSGLGIEVEDQEAVRLHRGDGSTWQQTGAG